MTSTDFPHRIRNAICSFTRRSSLRTNFAIMWYELRHLILFASWKGMNMISISIKYEQSCLSFCYQHLPPNKKVSTWMKMGLWMLSPLPLLFSLIPWISGQSCPDAEDIFPCTCEYVPPSNINVDCSSASTSEIFSAFNDVTWFPNLTCVRLSSFSSTTQ